jgi:hypothetical protein
MNLASHLVIFLFLFFDLLTLRQCCCIDQAGLELTIFLTQLSKYRMIGYLAWINTILFVCFP